LLTTIHEFGGLSAGSSPSDITLEDFDQTFWFTQPGTDQIGRITSAGIVSEYGLPGGSHADGITIGPDGQLWFSESGTDQIGIIRSDGNILQFPPLPTGSHPDGIVTGSDGFLWATEPGTDMIGKLGIMANLVNQFPLTAGSDPESITSGPDGALWFTEFGTNKIGRITTAGVLTEFAVTAGANPQEITVGPDGALWFTEPGLGQIGRITTSGIVTEFPLPTASSNPQGITQGPGGLLWFTERNANQIGRITPAGAVTEYALPTAGAGPEGIVTGPDGIWFTESVANQIGQLIPDTFLSATGVPVQLTEGSPPPGGGLGATVATFTDANPSAVGTDFNVTINWGDGTPLDTTTGDIPHYSSNPFNVFGSHAYAEEGQYQVTVTIQDINTPSSDGGSTAVATTTATVADAPLTLSPGFFDPDLFIYNNPVEISARSGTPGNPEVAEFTDQAPASSFGTYTAVINWGDGSPPSAGTVQPANGMAFGTTQLFTVIGTHTYVAPGNYTVTTIVTDDGGSSVSTTRYVNVVSQNESQNERFISQLYINLLNRPVDPSGLAFWSGVLALPGVTRDRIVRGIEDSPEYRMDVVEVLYQHYLSRAADPTGLSTFMAVLATPTGTPEQVAEAIIGSPEYVNTHTTVVNGGSLAGTYIVPLYEEALGRPIDSVGSATFFPIADGNSYQIAVDILASSEYLQDVVQSLYHQLLKRDADPDGLATYVGLLQGGATDQQIMADIAGSPEYLTKV
jgi:virginiamycin B lyase